MTGKENIPDANVEANENVDHWVHSTCNLCSIGCGCEIGVKDDKIVGIKGEVSHSINMGKLDPKAKDQWYANYSKDRLLTPMVRNENGELEKATWEEAMDLMVEQAKKTLKNKGPDGFSIYSTGQGFLEDFYTIAKVGRAGIGTHLLDANTRLCTATTEWCLLQSFGSDGVPASFEDFDHAETVMLFGHNPAETGTVLFDRIMERKNRTGKPYLIVVDPRETASAKEADLHLSLKPGTNAALLNGIIRQIISDGNIDRDYISRNTIEFNSMRNSIEEWTLAKTSAMTGIPEEQLTLAAKVLGETPSLVSTTLQGAFQSSDATTACVAINNLHLMRGLIGKPGCGPFHMAGQPSSSGNRTVGGVGTYPGNRNPANPDHLNEMAELWNIDAEKLEIGPEKGIMKQIEMIENDKISFFWNIHTNPLVSLPNRQRAKKALEKAFVVVQDPFLTETTEVADIVLPPAMWGEKEGTMENADRTINLLRKAVEPPEGVKSDFEILVEFSNRMGFKDKDGNPLIQYTTPEEAFEEWKKVSKGRPSDMSGMTYELLEKEKGIRWPATEDKPEGTTRLYEDQTFPTNIDYCQSFGKDPITGRPKTKAEFQQKNADGRAIFQPTYYFGSPEMPQDEYPFWLNTGRLLWHWHTRTKTARSKKLEEKAPRAYVEMNEDDAYSLRINQDDLVRVTSPRGEIQLPVHVDNRINQGEVFIPFHYGNWDGEQSANEMTMDVVDPVSHQPILKQAVCKVEKIS
ncbi:molybdopterin oxidoreductase family protein [Thalassobacillus pellis]|uniref:molybdopterin oxidoreductase family protein n=1 Tax=Thalassobacillus pellis TaxID=748008 RepID=UPI0019603702|nr:molybdopterin oxidoreductase family protein [Thalassobacillus pellis]MBM7552002.1 anaerobic selenocysteine-containing dehydrogenase [Thalassobacillus pellis]